MARTRGRPPTPLAPLTVTLDPRVKLDFTLAADELTVPLSFLVATLLENVRGREAGTANIKAAFRDAAAARAQTAN
jgi:hypothetical protein